MEIAPHTIWMVLLIFIIHALIHNFSYWWYSKTKTSEDYFFIGSLMVLETILVCVIIFTLLCTTPFVRSM